MKEMIKKYKGTLICSVLVMLAGILVGFTMAQSIWINVFFVVTDCILVTIIFYDNRNRQQSSKVIGMVIWMIPVTALIYNGMARLISMDADSENLFMAVIYFGTGLLFMIIGNYLPKAIHCMQIPIWKSNQSDFFTAVDKKRLEASRPLAFFININKSDAQRHS